jgi:exodeoxyribonuclease VII large subunit
MDTSLPPKPGHSRPVYTVTQVTEEISEILSGHFGTLSVEGEISGWKVASSGHAYFSLKDEHALLKGVIWRSRLERLSALPRDGQLVRVTGSLAVYPPRGEYQIDVTSVAQAGVGLLQKRFEELKRKLEAEGLFAAERKRQPPCPLRRILAITSPSGAALRDFLRTLELHAIPLEILIYPVRVQGVEAPGEIADALAAAPRYACDLVVVTRGGGSLEDLWAFNEEAVARAIAACPIPVLSAIGHEVDFTIADFVADLRASTPTAAAHYLAGEVSDVFDRLADMGDRLASAMRDCLAGLRDSLDAATRSLYARSPLAFIPFHRQRLDDLLGRAAQSVGRNLETQRSTVASLAQRLSTIARMDLLRWRGNLRSEQERLLVLDPRATLARGFALCETIEDQRPIRLLADVPKAGDVLVHLADGDFTATPSGG